LLEMSQSGALQRVIKEGRRERKREREKERKKERKKERNEKLLLFSTIKFSPYEK